MPAAPGQIRTKRLVLRRSGNTCERCGSGATTCILRKARGDGGAWVPENCASMCERCSDWVVARPGSAYAEGWVVRPFQSEGARQVLTWRGWMYLGEQYRPSVSA